MTGCLLLRTFGEVITSDRGAIINVIPPTPVADVQTQPDQVIDVIVTAEKKPERLQDVPISITSIGENEAEDADIENFSDVSANTPNLSMHTSIYNFVAYNVRGFSNFNFISRDSVAFYADIAGVEVEVRATPFKGFDAIAGFGYVDATFEDFSNPFDGEELESNNLPYVREYTYNLALQYRAKFGLFSRLELEGVGTSFFDNPNEFKRDPYTLVNARIGYEQDNYGIYFFANNIFNTEYLTTAFDFGSLGQIASYGNPATYGVQVKTQF